MPRSSRTLQLNLLVLLLATTTVLGRLISLPATAMVAWRTFLAMLGMGLWMLIWKKAPVRIPPALACKFLGVGSVIGLHWLLLFASVQVSNISIGLTGMASISLFTALTEPLMEGRRIRMHEILLGLLVLGGLALVAGVAAAMVAVATRAGIAARRATILILHDMGATDGTIARRFAGRIAWLAGLGAVLGAAAAAPLLWLLGGLAAPLLGDTLTMPWPALAALPPAAAGIAWATAHATLRLWLRSLP